MRLYQHTGNIKAGLFVLGLALVSGLMLYTQSLVKNLREDNREIVQLYAELMAKAVINESDENLNFIFENVIKKVQFPIVQTNVEGEPLSWRNLSEDIKNYYLGRNILVTGGAGAIGSNLVIALSELVGASGIIIVLDNLSAIKGDDPIDYPSLANVMFVILILRS